MPHLHRFLLPAILGTIAFSAFADDDFTRDQPGSADHPAIKRIEGAVIVDYDKKAFGEQCVALERVVFDYDKQKILPFKHDTVEGPQTRILYRAPANASTLEVLRQYEASLKASGFEVRFEGKGGPEDTSTLDNGYDRFLAQVYQSNGLPEKIYTPLSLNRDDRYAALRRTDATGQTDVTIFTVANTEWPDAFGTEKGQVLALVTITESHAMTDRMVVVKAAEMTSTIDKTGRIALYGIRFDTDKATIKPESVDTLAEMARLLAASPDRKFLIVGHTDNQGGYDYNVSLSKRRADAVVAALTSQHGVAASQIIPVGVGMAAPVAPNTDEPGRAKNRRVEIVPM